MSGKPDELDMRALDAVTGGEPGDMSEMSEMTSMRLQMAMDSRSKFLQTLSNIMKSMGDTASQITKNLK